MAGALLARPAAPAIAAQAGPRACARRRCLVLGGARRTVPAVGPPHRERPGRLPLRGRVLAGGHGDGGASSCSSWSRPRASVSRFLASGVLGYIGRISYGLYLYHWPLFLMIDNHHTGSRGTPCWPSGSAPPCGRRRLVPLHRDADPSAACPARAGICWWPCPSASPWSSSPSCSPPLPPPPWPSPADRADLFALPETAPPASLPPGNHVRVLLLGDSMALTLGEGLEVRRGAAGASPSTTRGRSGAISIPTAR